MTWPWRRTPRTPVPGRVFPGKRAAATTPSRPPTSPAPGHDYGPLDCVVKHYACGCRHYFDGTMCLVAVMPCHPDDPDLLDLEIRSFFTREDG